MSQLTIYPDDAPHAGRVVIDVAAIQCELDAIGVRFERWRALAPVTAGATQGEVLAAYRPQIDRLIAERGYRTVDVVSLHATHPEREALRQKFLAEHTRRRSAFFRGR